MRLQTFRRLGLASVASAFVTLGATSAQADVASPAAGCDTAALTCSVGTSALSAKITSQLPTVIDSGLMDKGLIKIRTRFTIDPVKGAAAAWKMVEALAGKPLPKGKVPAGLPIGLSLVDQATVVLDRKSGLPLRLQHRREVAFAGNSSIDTWTLDKVAAR